MVEMLFNASNGFIVTFKIGARASLENNLPI